MAYWLVKSEPTKYAFADLQRDGKTVWDGVRNNAAALHLKTMKVGDEVLYYHSQEGLCVVGVAKVVTEAFPDPGDPSGRFVAVELAPVRPVPRPVPLSDIKGNENLRDLRMLREFRLSVSPVTDAEFAEILRMGGA